MLPASCTYFGRAELDSRYPSAFDQLLEFPSAVGAHSAIKLFGPGTQSCVAVPCQPLGDALYEGVLVQAGAFCGPSSKELGVGHTLWSCTAAVLAEAQCKEPGVQQAFAWSDADGRCSCSPMCGNTQSWIPTLVALLSGARLQLMVRLATIGRTPRMPQMPSPWLNRAPVLLRRRWVPLVQCLNLRRLKAVSALLLLLWPTTSCISSWRMILLSPSSPSLSAPSLLCGLYASASLPQYHCPPTLCSYLGRT